MTHPFDTSGIATGPDGVRRYTDLPADVPALLRRAVERRPDAVAVGEPGGARLTYRQLWEAAARVAGGLRAAGVTPGDRVANRLPNGVDWVLTFWGTLLAGAVAVPVNTRFAGPEVRYVVEDSGAALVVEPGAPLPDGDPVVAPVADHDTLAAIFYTSGTTGFPKGAMTTHGNFLSNVETCLRCMSIDREEPLTTLVSVPLFHVTGCNSQLLVATAVAGTTVVMPAFEVTAFLRAVQEERVTHLVSVPAVYWLALQQPGFPDVDTSSVRAVNYGGAPIAPDLVHRIQRAFPAARVGNGFGLTETSSVTTFLPHEYAAEHADSVGFPAPVVELDLADVDPRTGVGELLVRGPNVVAGYWRKPEQTAATFVDGWLHTGDLARIDDLGLTYVVDRKKDMINRGGENVYCVEVENVLAAHPAVGEVAVVGVPDPMMGEKVGAVVVPRPGGELAAADLLAFARVRLADFKVPQYLAVRSDPLPRNPGGKVLKPPLRAESEWLPVG
ncbi:class I adenylate-forming enzyme family protein [Geodermatophilus sp. SYSU D00742]